MIITTNTAGASIAINPNHVVYVKEYDVEMTHIAFVNGSEEYIKRNFLDFVGELRYFVEKG
jgi:uncharacterized Fe-S cluster-containing protein